VTRRRKVLLWLGVCVSLPLAVYAGMSFFFYAWLNASGQWSADRAAVWAYSSAMFAVALAGVFIYCVVSLIREANRAYREEQRAT
jgi:hypothetical protein